MNWLRNKLRRWLGVEADKERNWTDVAHLIRRVSDIENRIHLAEDLLRQHTTGLVDVAYKENSVIIIASKLGGGYISIKPLAVSSMSELRVVTRDLEARCRDVYVDLPYGHRRFE